MKYLIVKVSFAGFFFLLRYNSFVTGDFNVCYMGNFDIIDCYCNFVYKFIDLDKIRNVNKDDDSKIKLSKNKYKE